MTVDKIIGLILSIVSLIAIICILFRKKEPFFNFREIMKDHLCLFSNCKSQYFIFYVLPLFLGVGISLLFSANTAFFSHLGVVLSIILSMLLALLAILTGYDFSIFKDNEQRNTAETTVKQTINAILFCCIIGIVLLLIGFIVIATSGKDFEWIPFDINVCKIVISAFTYYLFIVVLLNLLLIIKNMSKIIEAKMLIERNGK